MVILAEQYNEIGKRMYYRKDATSSDATWTIFPNIAFAVQ